MAVTYPTTTAQATPWRLLLRTAVAAGTVAAVVEMVPVLGIQAGALGVPPSRVLQSIASGLLGRAAYDGGAVTVAAGTALHWLISCGAALTFAWAASRWHDLVRHPVPSGLAFGVLAFAVMTAVVVPFSAAAFPPNRDPALMLLSIAIHMAFFGLPIALTTRRWLHRAGWEG